MENNAYEIYREPKTGTVFYFSHSGKDFTTGVMEIPPNTELPKHNRTLAYENALQLSGRSVVKLFEDNSSVSEHEMKPGDSLRMKKGQFHIHANPFDEVSYSLFKADGDISDAMDHIRENYTKLG